ncbi:hypothetical protein ACNOYE_00025 [Nannocystaceae bacterium ST9]
MAELETRLRSDPQALMRWGPVVIWCSRGVIDQTLFGRVHDELAAALTEYPEGAGLLMISSSGSELAEFGLRRRIADTLAEFGDRLQVAAVLEGGSWWVSGARKLVGKILAQVPARVPIATFTDREQALIWLSETLRGPDQRPVDLDELGPALEQALGEWTAAPAGSA